MHGVPPFLKRRVGHPPAGFGPLQLAQSYHPVAPAVKMGIETRGKGEPPAFRPFSTFAVVECAAREGSMEGVMLLVAV